MISLSTCVLVTLSFLAVTWGQIPRAVADSGYYVTMAEGHVEAVPKPFSNRLLLPFAVRALTATGLLDTDQAFTLWSVVALATIACGLGLLFVSEGIGPLWAIVLLFSPFTLKIFAASFLPDLFQASLLIMAFIFLANKRAALCVVFLFLAVTAREATLLAIVVLAFLAWRSRNRPLAAGSLLAGIVGVGSVAVYTQGAPGNEHGLPVIAYLFFKVPYNGLKNLLGIELWTNTLASLSSWKSRAPSVVFHLPHWLELGRVRSIGLMPWRPEPVLENFAIILTTFGTWPAVYWGARPWKKARYNRPHLSELWLRWSAVYGLLAFLISPFLGASVWRLVGYGWPAFWLAAPVLVFRANPSPKAWTVLMLSSLAIAWLPALLSRVGVEPLPAAIAIVLVAGSSWLATALATSRLGHMAGPASQG